MEPWPPRLSPQVSVETHERLAAVALSPDGRLALTAGAQGVVTLRWLHSLQVRGRDVAGRVGVWRLGAAVLCATLAWACAHLGEGAGR